MVKYADLFKALILTAIYFATAKFGLTLDAVAGFATLVWLPTGISLAALLILGLRFYPAITLGAFLTNLTAGAPPLVALGIAIGNTSEALIGAYLLKKVGFKPALNTLRDVLVLILFASFFSTISSATIGVSALLIGKIIIPEKYLETWTAWWVGDMISDLVIAPFILVWSNTKINLNLKLSYKRVLETFLLTFSLLAVIILIFREFFNLGTQTTPRVYMAFPILIWAALRFGQKGAVSITFILSILSVFITSLGYGPFAYHSLHQSLLAVQSYLAVVSISAMILAAIALERKRLEERKDEFISMASHELKTPITTIKGYTQILNQLLKDGSGSVAKYKRLLTFVGKMDEQLNRLTELVNDLLDVSKIQAGKLQLKKEKVDINDLTKDVVSDIQMISQNHQIIFKKNTDNSKVLADKHLIAEVLINLISNAIKYSPKADKVIVQTKKESGSLVVSVQDFGIGISEKDQAKIFERFFQASNKIRESFSGLGLGLYICSEIISRHKGTIWVNSIKGKGSTISFSLPNE